MTCHSYSHSFFERTGFGFVGTSSDDSTTFLVCSSCWMCMFNESHHLETGSKELTCFCWSTAFRARRDGPCSTFTPCESPFSLRMHRLLELSGFDLPLFSLSPGLALFPFPRSTSSIISEKYSCSWRLVFPIYLFLGVTTGVGNVCASLTSVARLIWYPLALTCLGG